MYKLYFTNIPDRGLVGEYSTLDAAKAAGKRYGFEFTVELGGNVIGAYSTFGGWRSFKQACDAERFGDPCKICDAVVVSL